ncbi:MAG: DUF3006 domain-containing protein [Clostridiales bacterium]|jgi:hypothetical protein|nr:DUF3006 domain-containing protein [Clostridiales bacterium]
MSRTVTIDRFEGTFAICEGEGHGKEVKMYAIEIAELPQGAKEGDVLVISDSGELSVDTNETASRRSKIKKMQDSLWE